MEANELTTVACDAIQTALQQHKDRNATLSEDDRQDINARIQLIFVLRDQAADKQLALLEIACDAAAQFADDYNYQNPTSPHIQPKWMYIIVQALLAPHLKPELISGDVPRLSLPHDNDHQESVGAGRSVPEQNDDGGSSGAISQLPTTNSGPKWGQDKPLIGHRSFWPSHEVKQLIWLHKYKTLPQNVAAVRLGRTLHSVTNKWAKIVKDQAFEGYIAECDNARAQDRSLPRPTTPT